MDHLSAQLTPLLFGIRSMVGHTSHTLTLNRTVHLVPPYCLLINFTFESPTSIIQLKILGVIGPSLFFRITEDEKVC